MGEEEEEALEAPLLRQQQETAMGESMEALTPRPPRYPELLESAMEVGLVGARPAEVHQQMQEGELAEEELLERLQQAAPEGDPEEVATA